jgi:hypothetical protein
MKKSTAATVDFGSLQYVFPAPSIAGARCKYKGGMNVIEIAFSESKFDQWRLQKAGGFIVIGVDGKPRFGFSTRKQFMTYCRLKNEMEVAK